MEVNAKITPKTRDEFMQAMTEFASNMKIDMHDVIIGQAGLACYDAIVFTPPMLDSGGGGNSNDAKKLGEKSVELDIKSVFEVPTLKEATSFQYFRSLCGALYVGDKGLFAKLMNDKRSKNSRNSIFSKIVSDPDNNRAFGKMKNLLSKFVPRYGGLDTATYEQAVTDLEAIHQRLLKTANGRKIRDKTNLGLMGYNKYVAESQQALIAYIKKKQMDVGKLKAGWVAAMKSLPAKKGKSKQKNYGGKINKWITRHGLLNGYNQNSLNNSGFMYLKIGNSIGDNDGVATKAETANLVYGNRVKQMEADYNQFLEKNIKKFNNK